MPTLVDRVGLRRDQYRALSGLLRLGGAVAELDGEDDDDVTLVGPYGEALDRLRDGRWRPAGRVVMVDLKGPSGIDAAIMSADRLGERFTYLTPMWGQPQFRERLAYLDGRCRSGPLPFPPHPRQLEHARLADAYVRQPAPAGRRGRLGFAGAVWGRRAEFIAALRAAFGVAIDIRDGLDPTAYRIFLQQSLAAIDIAGNHNATYRFAEIMLSGACPLVERRAVFMLGNPPVDGEHLALWSTADELVEVARTALGDPEAAAAIGARGWRWYAETQSPAAITAFVTQAAATASVPLVRDSGPWEDGILWSSWASA